MDGFKYYWFYISLGRVPVYFTEPHFFYPGCLCCSNYYDGTESPKSERQGSGAGRLPDQY